MSTAIEKARKALRAAGYDTHDQSSGPGIYIADAAPDSAGASTEPGSPWDKACDAILADVKNVVEPCGCEAEWVDDDVVICEVKP